MKNYDKEIKVYLKSEQKYFSKSKAIETLRTKKPIIFQAIIGAHYKRVGAESSHITGVQAQIHGKTLKYNFQFYSEESKIIFDFAKHGNKLGLSQ